MLVNGRADEPVDAVLGGRLDVQWPAPLHQVRVQPIRPTALVQHVFAQPWCQRFAILRARLAKPQERTDLSAMVLNGTALPLILKPFGSEHTDLAGDVFDGA